MLEINNISKIYSNKKQQVEAIGNISLKVEDCQFAAILGPSGCGKTTLLKIVAGLAEPSSGEVILDGRKIDGPGKDRGMVFQNFSLFPWLKVRDNISFGLNLQNFSSAEKKTIIDNYLFITGLSDFVDLYPKNLSGGMQQRVAIARTLANNPKILLMDEPFGSLDSQTRSRMQDFLVKLWEADQRTILFVTHDVEEAIFLADTVYLLSEGPARIKKIFPVPFERPRLNELKCEHSFFEMKRQIAREMRLC